MTLIAVHPQSNSLRLQLHRNLVLRDIGAEQWHELEPLMRIIGKQLVVALANAVKPLRKPGADTVRQMPGFCVMKPVMDAA